MINFSQVLIMMLRVVFVIRNQTVSHLQNLTLQFLYIFAWVPFMKYMCHWMVVSIILDSALFQPLFMLIIASSFTGVSDTIIESNRHSNMLFILNRRKLISNIIIADLLIWNSKMHQPKHASSHSEQKWKQIQRNLAEQESFVQSIMAKGSPDHASTNSQNHGGIQNILSSSIQKAKQKITTLEAKSNEQLSSRNSRSKDNLAHSRDKLSQSRDSHSRDRSDKQNSNLPLVPNQSDNSAIAKAMKKLQEKTNTLEQQKQKIQNDYSKIMVELQAKKQQIIALQSTLQESKRKSKNLEVSLYNDKKQIKELERIIQSYEDKLKDKGGMDKEKKLEQKLSASEMLYRAQNQEIKNYVTQLENKEKKIWELQNLRKEEQIKHLEFETATQTQIKQLQLKKQALEDRDAKKQGLIGRLKEQIKNLEAENKILQIQGSKLQKQTEQEPKHKVNQPRQSNHIHRLQQEVDYYNEKYEELSNAHRMLDEKYKREKVECKNFRNKFWELKDLTKQIIEKISSLPNAVTSQLRYLIVKVNKIQAFGQDYYLATPTKSTRKKSLLGNYNTDRSHSKSRSKSKSVSKSKINLNSDMLNCSKNSAKSNRSILSNRSMSKKDSNKSLTRNNKSKSKTKQKQVIISQKSIKNNQIKQLQQQIQDIRGRYKELLMHHNSDADSEVSEDVRNQLNDLAVMLQMKSEELTKLKRKKL